MTSIALEPWYHTPFDTIDHISQDRIQEAGELIGSAIYDVVRKQTPENKQPSTPIMQMQWSVIWNKGSKR